MSALQILILDDEPNIRRTLAIALEVDGHRVVAVSNAADALDLAAQQAFDLALIDLRLGTDSGLDVIAPLIARSPWTRVVVITAFAEIETAVEAMRRGAFDYLAKPFSPAQVAAVAARVAELRRVETRQRDPQSDTHGANDLILTSRSAPARRAFELARQFAASDVTVLLRGESGTGKSALAKAIHGWSPRAAMPFGTVSTPSLSAELAESELFGHVKGAFTGAVRDAAGRVAATDGGTLFLDEIGDMPMTLQPKLLRFLQEREYERVGDSTTRRANLRVIAATNVDLEQAVKNGRFREDLFYRLNVVQIDMPPLRDRREDVLPLAERMLGSIAGTSTAGISDEAAAALRVYDWPGNLRELRNAIERAVVLAGGGKVLRDHLPAAVLRPDASQPAGAGQNLSLDAVEERHIRRVLATTRTLDEAAKALGIDVATLWRRRKKFGI